MNRYDKNYKLYEKVKNGEFEDYNNQITDVEYDVDINMKRSEFQEKKRLAVYFEDIQKELNNAAIQLENLSTDSQLEIKPDVDLRSLIEQAKRKNGDSVKIFSNTQHEILSKLDIEETNNDSVSLEDIIGEDEITFNTVVLDLENKDDIYEDFDSDNLDTNSSLTQMFDQIESDNDELNEEEITTTKIEVSNKKPSKLSNMILTIILIVLIIVLSIIGLLLLKEFI